MVKGLTQEEFEGTMAPPMTNVTETAEAIVDIWPYVKQLTDEGSVNQYVYDKQLVELVYRNGMETYDHVLLPMADKNVFITIVVDIVKEQIFGHYKLDLKKRYDINQS